jgi:hypothetical protein
MFVAKFNQVTSDRFTADKNGNMPFIGEVLAGSSRGALINGTMFHRNGFAPNKLYACENFTDEEYPDSIQTRIIAEVGIIEFMSLRTALGAPKNNYGTVAAEEPLDVLDDSRD